MVWGSERYKLPQWGMGEPLPKLNLVNFSLKIGHLVATILISIPQKSRRDTTQGDMSPSPAVNVRLWFTHAHHKPV